MHALRITVLAVFLICAGCGSQGNAPTPNSDSIDDISGGIIDETPTVAFPGAEGFGRFAQGGRGGDVYHVTSLADSGDGSLREGVQSATGSRTIVFDLSGTIFLKSALKLDSPYLTIAGQTAPGDGITLAGHVLKVSADHVIIRYIRSRLGDSYNVEEDAISITSGSHIILDHVSASWSVDETLSNNGDDVDLVTVQWSIVSESLNSSLHEKGEHGYGGIMGAKRQSYHHNLFAHHRSRTPKISWRQHTKVDFRNNVIYNWGTNNSYDGTSSHANWVNNYYKAGPATEEKVRQVIFNIQEKETAPDLAQYPTQFYIEGNVLEGNVDVSSNNWAGGIKYSDGTTEVNTRSLQAFDYPEITQTTAEKAYVDVLESAGASLNRDAVDIRVIASVTNGTGVDGVNGIIDSQNDVGGWPELSSLPALLDNDQDGMPDDWEINNGLDPFDASDRNTDLFQNGYTALEHYLNALVEKNTVSQL